MKSWWTRYVIPQLCGPLIDLPASDRANIRLTASMRLTAGPKQMAATAWEAGDSFRIVSAPAYRGRPKIYASRNPSEFVDRPNVLAVRHKISTAHLRRLFISRARAMLSVRIIRDRCSSRRTRDLMKFARRKATVEIDSRSRDSRSLRWWFRDLWVTFCIGILSSFSIHRVRRNSKYLGYWIPLYG